MTNPTASVIADSEANGERLVTMQITAHRFILAEINTHRVFSRNYRSSRAVPVEKLLEEVRTDPAMPVFWGKNKAGMQADEELNFPERGACEQFWREGAWHAVKLAKEMANFGLHKQIANRLLEPYLMVHGVISATEWMNFFGLRLDKAAQPEMRALAEAMWAAFNESKPNKLAHGEWHLPFIAGEDRQAKRDRANARRPSRKECASGSDYHDKGVPFHLEEKNNLIKQSVARCARVSYKPFDADRPSTLEEDLRLYDKLVGTQPIHASPAEHQATPDTRLDFDNGRPMTNPPPGPWAKPHLHGNFTGFCQYRKMLEGERVAPLPLGYGG